MCLYCRRLKSRYPDLEILKQISQQVDQGSETMRSQLISLLGGSVKLPICIRIIGYLRRMGSYEDSELKRVFLSQRDSYLQFLLNEIPRKDPSEYMKKYIEVCREAFFDILTQ